MLALECGIAAPERRLTPSRQSGALLRVPCAEGPRRVPIRVASSFEAGSVALARCLPTGFVLSRKALRLQKSGAFFLFAHLTSVRLHPHREKGHDRLALQLPDRGRTRAKNL